MNENLEMIRGDTFSFDLEIEDLSSDLTSAYFSCKKNKDDEEYLFQKSLENGIEKIDSTDTSRTYKFTLSPNDTNDFEKGNYFYDIQIVVNDDVFTPFIGILRIIDDVTRN